jgi:hypothetical protein
MHLFSDSLKVTFVYDYKGKKIVSSVLVGVSLSPYILRLIHWSSVLCKRSNNKVWELHTQEQLHMDYGKLRIVFLQISVLDCKYFLRLNKVFQKQSSQAFKNTVFQLGGYVFLMSSTP